MPERTKTLTDTRRLLNCFFTLFFGKPDGASGAALDRSAGRFMLVSFLLLVFGGLIVPPDGSPMWLSLAWIALASLLVGWFVVAAGRLALDLRAYLSRRRDA